MRDKEREKWKAAVRQLAQENIILRRMIKELSENPPEGNPR